MTSSTNTQTQENLQHSSFPTTTTTKSKLKATGSTPPKSNKPTANPPKPLPPSPCPAEPNTQTPHPNPTTRSKPARTRSLAHPKAQTYVPLHFPFPLHYPFPLPLRFPSQLLPPSSPSNSLRGHACSLAHSQPPHSPPPPPASTAAPKPHPYPKASAR